MALIARAIPSNVVCEGTMISWREREKEFLSVVLVPVNREYVLISKDSDSYQTSPQANWMSFDGIKDASIVKARDFSGRLNRAFTVRMWMKHANDDDSEKEHIFCQSDQKCKNSSVDRNSKEKRFFFQ